MSSKIIGKISNKKLLKKLTEIDAEKVAVRRILDELGISESERKIQLNLTTGEVSEATDEICEAAD